MFTKFIVLTITISVIYLAHSLPIEQIKEKLTKLNNIVCQQNLSAEHQEITNECDQDVPSIIKYGYLNCVRQSMNITDITLPFICYSYMAGGEKIKECLDKKGQIATSLGFNMEAIRNRVLNRYMDCIKTRIELKMKQDESESTPDIIPPEVVRQ